VHLNNKVVTVFEAQAVSIGADQNQRHGLNEVERLARAGTIKKILVHEVSRLGRRNSIVNSFVEMRKEVGVSLYWHAQGIETMMANGKRNSAASIMPTLLAEMVRNETETLRERINSGIANTRKNGTKKGSPFGRPVGSGLDGVALLAKHKDMVKALKAGKSIRNAAKITGKGGSTVQRVAAALKG
jgi:DNA invertase Pin-like site-specific DNA recombinase